MFYLERVGSIILLTLGVLVSLYTLNCGTDTVLSAKNSGITDSFYLEKANSAHNILLSKSFLQDPPEAVQFAVTVENKNLETFSVNIFITDSLSKFVVGNFAAYPLNEGGNYVFRINQPVRQFLFENYEDKVPQKNVYLQFVLQEDKGILNQLRIGIKQFKWIKKLN